MRYMYIKYGKPSLYNTWGSFSERVFYNVNTRGDNKQNYQCQCQCQCNGSSCSDIDITMLACTWFNVREKNLVK